jgi:uncharacterized protein YecE (DUF72 family)
MSSPPVLAETRRIYVGCAGWNVPKAHAEHFPEDGTHLQRYAGTLPAVEINSSFYRPHKPSTYERWAGSVPEAFRFAVKVPRAITHNRRLKGVEIDLRAFLEECAHLGPKLGPLLVQLPPSLAFDHEIVDAFFALLRLHFSGDVACEPRHVSWFASEPENVLSSFNVARVAADPSVVAEAAEPGGWGGLVYYRLHGSPRIYYSAYETGYLKKTAGRLVEARANGAQVWCIFDNTAEGAAAGDALAVLNMVGG